MSSLCPCNCKYHRSVDISTPRGVNLSAFYKRSFAFHSVREILPIILKNIMEDLMNRRDELADQYGENVREELKVIVDNISKLKYELQTNKELKPLESNKGDVEIFNNYLNQRKSADGRATPYNTAIMLTESYIYRKVNEIFEKQSILKEFDPFQLIKQGALEEAIPIMRELATHMAEGCECISDKDALYDLMKIALWSNKYDLACGRGIQPGIHLSSVRKLNPNIICDQSEKIWDALHDNAENDCIDYVLDNAGYELFADFCLIDLMITKNLTHHVTFHCKEYPCFVSATTTSDIAWMLTLLKESPDPHLRRLGQRWSDYIAHQTVKVMPHTFWSYPVDYLQMESLAPDLYSQLTNANLIIVKGDLGYRKLMGDINCNPTMPLKEGMRGFLPSRIVMLRVIKYGVICGLDEEIAEKCSKVDWNWADSGIYGIIQYCDEKYEEPAAAPLDVETNHDGSVDLSFLDGNPPEKSTGGETAQTQGEEAPAEAPPAEEPPAEEAAAEEPPAEEPAPEAEE